MQVNYQQQFYHSQNIDLRKEIRELDLRLAQGDSNLTQCNFLVVGPPKVGKTSLLKTLQFALNGSQGWGIACKGPVATVEIKKGARWQVEGVKELRQISQKFGVSGIELLTDQKASSRYKKALQFVESSFGNCMIESSELQSRSKAKVCLILLNSSIDVPADELAYLKFLRVDMLERGVKTLLILLGSFDRHSQNWKKIQAKITTLHTEFQVKREDIICIDTYNFGEYARSNGKIQLKQSQMNSNKIQNNEQINFYALQLLIRIVRESERNTKAWGVKPRGWLCSWK